MLLPPVAFSLPLLPLPLVLTFGFACLPCSVSVGFPIAMAVGRNPCWIPSPFLFCPVGVTSGDNLSSLGLASPETEGYLCILLPSWSSEQGCFYDQLLPMSLLPMPAFIGLLWKEGPHRLLSQLMVFVITIIRCPCSHSLPLCPKGRNSGARCRPPTCHGSAWLF